MEDLRQRLAECEARANLATALLASSLAEADRLRSEAAELRDLRSAYDALINSTSWRITAPLRKATAALQQLRRR